MPIRKLPDFEGWTVDARLKQFRKVHEDGWIDFLDWARNHQHDFPCLSFLPTYRH